MTRTFEYTHEPIIINSLKNDQMNSLTLSTKSNEESPKHRYSSSTPTDQEQSKIKI